MATVPNSNTIINSASRPNMVNQVSEDSVNYRVMYEPEPIRFSDDEPLSMVTGDTPADQHIVRIKAIPERLNVSSLEDVSDFAVLVKVAGPPPSDDFPQIHRGPVDLVAVLDVSGSMHGSKLVLLKSAVEFFIDKLGPSDRLSIVAFSTNARRILPLRKMTEQGRKNAKWCVNSLSASGSTNIVEALKKGVQVLEERRYQDPVSGIVFFTDGRDTCYRGTHFLPPGHHPQYLHLLPGSINPAIQEMEEQDQLQTFPVYSLYFGEDHDHFSMLAISEASGGDYTYIVSRKYMKEAVQNCIKSLSFVKAQKLLLRIRSSLHRVQIRSITSKGYASKLSNQGSRAAVYVGNLSAGDNKNIMINVNVLPVFGSLEEISLDSKVMHLLHITYSYREVVTKQMVQHDVDPITIRRPKHFSPYQTAVDHEVEMEKNDILVAESFTEAQYIAERSDLTGARTLLRQRMLRLNDDRFPRFHEAIFEDLLEKMETWDVYESDGRRYSLENIYSRGSPNMVNQTW